MYLSKKKIKPCKQRNCGALLKMSGLLVYVGVKIMRFWMFIICGDWPVIKP